MRHPVIVSYCFLLFLLLTSLVLAPVALLQAQDTAPSVSAPTFDLSWWTVDGGGSTTQASSPSYTLVGTIGQADAGLMEGTGYGLVGGFWATVPAGYNHHIYLPLVVRNTP